MATSAGDAPVPRSVESEIEDFRKDCQRLAHIGSVQARNWELVHSVLGLPAAVIAAISGTTGLTATGARVPAAILALISAGLVAAASFLHPQVRAEEARVRTNALLVLDAQAKFALIQARERRRGVPLETFRSLLERKTMIVTGRTEQLQGDGGEGIQPPPRAAPPFHPPSSS